MKAGWRVVPLGKLVEIRPTKRETRIRLKPDQPVSFVPMEDLKEIQRNFAPKQVRPLSEVYGGYTYFAEDDVLLAKITPCFENGKLSVARGLKNGVGFGSSEFMVLRCDTKLDPDYLFYFLSRDVFRENGKGRMTGAVGHKRVPPEFVQSQELPLPPLDEQKRIVAVLDEAFEGLSRARANAEANLADTMELNAVAADAVLYEHAPGERIGSLAELFGPVSTGPFGSILHQSDYVENQTPLVNPAHILNGRIVPDFRKTIGNEALQRLGSYRLRQGDIVLGRRGEMGRCAVVGETEEGWLCGTGSFFIRPKSSDNPDYVAAMIRSRSFVKKLEVMASGATVQNISNKDLGLMQMSLPPREVQDERMTRIALFYEKSDDLSRLFKARLSELDTLRQSLLQKAFSGELT